MHGANITMKVSDILWDLLKTFILNRSIMAHSHPFPAGKGRKLTFAHDLSYNILD